jgi:hypothetical protein
VTSRRICPRNGVCSLADGITGPATEVRRPSRKSGPRTTARGSDERTARSSGSYELPGCHLPERPEEPCSARCSTTPQPALASGSRFLRSRSWLPPPARLRSALVRQPRAMAAHGMGTFQRRLGTSRDEAGRLWIFLRPLGATSQKSCYVRLGRYFAYANTEIPGESSSEPQGLEGDARSSVPDLHARARRRKWGRLLRKG